MTRAFAGSPPRHDHAVAFGEYPVISEVPRLLRGHPREVKAHAGIYEGVSSLFKPPCKIRSNARPATSYSRLEGERDEDPFPSRRSPNEPAHASGGSEIEKKVRTTVSG